MKKVYLLGFILAASVAQDALADTPGMPVGVPAPQPGCPKAFQGFGLKGNIGYGVGWSKARSGAIIVDTDADTTVVAGKRFKRGVDGFDGGIGVDYTHRICNWTVGIEFDANWTNTKGNGSFAVATVDPNGDAIGYATRSQLRLRNSLQLLGKFGVVFREIVNPFIALGWDNSQWKHKGGFALVETEAGEVAELTAAGGSKSKRINSLLWRVGADFLATRHVVLGFEYTGTYGGKVKFSRARSFDAGAVAVAGHDKPQYNKFALTAKIIY